MDAWAESYGSSAAFICVCCAGPQLAYTFREQLSLEHCYNTWVDQGPAWGQLGCSGLIVIDGADNVVCRASPAYLEVKEDAFRYVETLLSAMTGAKSVPQAPSVGFGGGGGGCANGTCGDVKFGADRVAAEVQKAPSVKVDVLDAEHEACEEMLRRVLAAAANQQGRELESALRGLLDAYTGHFAHEEALLDKHLYADIGRESEGGFSADRGARTSHYADHKAMLSAVEGALAKAGSLTVADARRLAAEFNSHATKYDGNYADRLSAAIAVAE
eukprot:TRINITY_DN3963_c0_g1_i1.p3 TRINITY_DN3963_c0_g1~~TRINITY_DN3963_c0_g1_i1.p3  ORF type:complete len:273 (+),score=77.09 TRINITY_DN3963_c0_g1_i1:217-1035(+)